MKKISILLLFSLPLFILAACGEDNTEGDIDTDLSELKQLEVALDVTEEADINETVEMNAAVTHGDEDVDDADEVVFEVWEESDQDNSEMIDSTNNDDGSYSAETTFDHDGLFHIQSHVTARETHTMPEKEVTVGDGGDYDDLEADGDDEFETDGFEIMFMKPEDVKVGEETELMTHILIDEDPLKGAQVRYEIWNHDESSQHKWEDADETSDGEYVTNYTFEDKGNYIVQIHVEDDDDLHEQKEHKLEVK